MFVEGGWRPPEEPGERGAARRRERVIVWLIALNAAALFIAPIGGATLLHALLAALRPG